MSAPSKVPATVPGHWDTDEGREMAERYLERPRDSLGKSELSDFALANAQYLEDIHAGNVTFQSAIGMQTAAKERIRWLSAHLAAAESLSPTYSEAERSSAANMLRQAERNGHTAEEIVDLIAEVLGMQRAGH